MAQVDTDTFTAWGTGTASSIAFVQYPPIPGAVDPSIDQVFTAFSFAGAPLTGLTPTWSTYQDVATGDPVASPSFREVGGGVYAFTPNMGTGQHQVGIIDLGATASPRYLFWDAGGSAQVFAAFSLAGAPLAGLSPVWSTYRDILTGDPVSSPFLFEVGGGIYAFYPNVETDQAGIIDFGGTANPRYLSWDSSYESPAGPTLGGGASFNEGLN